MTNDQKIRIVGAAGGVLSVSVLAAGRWRWLGYYPTDAEAMHAATKILTAWNCK